MPQAPKCYRPTLNKMGFQMHPLSDAYVDDFVEYSKNCHGTVADLGCAYGLTTMRVLEERGDVNVIANDLSRDHLNQLTQSLSDKPELLKHLTLMPGNALELDIEANSLDGILAANWLHFVQPNDVTKAFGSFYKWLKPGGKLFVITCNTHMKIKPEARKRVESLRAAGDPWPGKCTHVLEDLEVPEDLKHCVSTYFLMIDPETLVREAEKAGFFVEMSGFSLHDDYPMPDHWQNDGKEFSGIRCRKPK